MKSSIILKTAEYDPDTDIIIHEAAHCFHVLLEPDFTKLWTFQFPRVRRLEGETWDNEDLRRRSHSVSRYAQFDSLIDAPLVAETPRIAPFKEEEGVYAGIGITMKTYDDTLAGVEDKMRLITQRLNDLPGRLRESVESVIVDPQQAGDGWCSYWPIRQHRDFGRVCEDIAEHTRWFEMARRNPAKYEAILRQISDDRVVRQKLETLIQYGFLDRGYHDSLNRNSQG